MSKTKGNCDVFLSYSLTERPIGEKVAQAMRNAGLEVFCSADLPAGSTISEEIHHALAVSDALVLVLSSEGTLGANTGVELGAAMAWNKPICVVRPENGRIRMPKYLSDYPEYPISRIDDVVRAVKKGRDPLSSEEQNALKAVYVSMDTPTDHLVHDPAKLDELARRFKTHTGSRIAGERLLYEMIRLRKKGQWPHLGRKRKATT